MKFNNIKPYLFILVIFLLPLLFIPVIKHFKSTHPISQVKGIKKDSVSNIYAIAIHGGAGNFTKKDLTDKQVLAYKNALFDAIETGKQKLASGVNAIDVVQLVINKLENSGLFNAGKGAVLNADGIAELDASIMDGATLNAGAVAGVRTIKNPITAARYVMDSSSHVLLSGRGAELFAKKMALDIVDNKYFITPQMLSRYKKSKEKHGTVGCVVLDIHGNLAAGTSTGGMFNKKYGRIGDSPIIGAGTYARNSTCAVSCTGYGEYFIRLSIAHEISSLVRYKNVDIQQAADFAIHKELSPLGGEGGVIVVDQKGDVAISFNTSGMFRAYYSNNGKQEIKFF